MLIGIATIAGNAFAVVTALSLLMLPRSFGADAHGRPAAAAANEIGLPRCVRCWPRPSFRRKRSSTRYNENMSRAVSVRIGLRVVDAGADRIRPSLRARIDKDSTSDPLLLLQIQRKF